MKLTVELSDEQLEIVAARAAALAVEQLRDVMPAAPVSAWLSVKDAAAFIAASSEQRIYDLQSSGRLSRFKEGGRTLVSRAELEALVVADRVARALPTAALSLVASGVDE